MDNDKSNNNNNNNNNETNEQNRSTADLTKLRNFNQNICVLTILAAAASRNRKFWNSQEEQETDDPIDIVKEDNDEEDKSLVQSQNENQSSFVKFDNNILSKVNGNENASQIEYDNGDGNNEEEMQKAEVDELDNFQEDEEDLLKETVENNGEHSSPSDDGQKHANVTQKAMAQLFNILTNCQKVPPSTTSTSNTNNGMMIPQPIENQWAPPTSFQKVPSEEEKSLPFNLPTSTPTTTTSNTINPNTLQFITNLLQQQQQQQQQQQGNILNQSTLPTPSQNFPTFPPIGKFPQPPPPQSFVNSIQQNNLFKSGGMDNNQLILDSAKLMSNNNNNNNNNYSNNNNNNNLNNNNNFMNNSNNNFFKNEKRSSDENGEYDEENKRDNKKHIKKPLNAFMLFMKEQRASVVNECTLRESAAINQILGKKWHELDRAEQAKYYEKARVERMKHMEKYPDWSARDNYGMKKKKRKNSNMPSEYEQHHLQQQQQQQQPPNSSLQQQQQQQKMMMNGENCTDEMKSQMLYQLTKDKINFPLNPLNQFNNNNNNQQQQNQQQFLNKLKRESTGQFDFMSGLKKTRTNSSNTNNSDNSTNSSGGENVDFRRKLKNDRPMIPTESARKCRARYGLNQMELWCKPCRRKKRCIRFATQDDTNSTGKHEDKELNSNAENVENKMLKSNILPQPTPFVHGHNRNLVPPFPLGPFNLNNLPLPFPPNPAIGNFPQPTTSTLPHFNFNLMNSLNSLTNMNQMQQPPVTKVDNIKLENNENEKIDNEKLTKTIDDPVSPYPSALNEPNYQEQEETYNNNTALLNEDEYLDMTQTDMEDLNKTMINEADVSGGSSKELIQMENLMKMFNKTDGGKDFVKNFFSSNMSEMTNEQKEQNDENKLSNESIENSNKNELIFANLNPVKRSTSDASVTQSAQSSTVGDGGHHLNECFQLFNSFRSPNNGPNGNELHPFKTRTAAII
ncbi:hypothetical protein SNEBB_011121 [Seison nebaliae]|nr:hypothetical protein SNEBB_011121 [Seison nebaliae]